MSGPAGIADWLVDKTSRVLHTRLSRRGFISKATIAGSAVAASGCVGFNSVVYQSDCRGGLCRDGYTDFCCMITGGYNTCPPGSIPSGWWAAGGSVFCPDGAGNPGTRYIVDCNDFGGGGPCRCSVDCNTRKVYCNRFRYGQCNTQVGGTGVIACRVVTCVPPYAIAEFNCNASGASDNSTANHSAPCPDPAQLEPPPPPPVPLPVALAVGSVFGAGGNLTFVARAQDGSARMVQSSSASLGTASWQQLGGTVATVSSRIAIAAYGAGRMLAVAEDAATGQPTWSDFDGISWSAWALLDGLIASDPVLVTQGTSVVMTVRGHDAALHYRIWDGTTQTWDVWIGGTPEITNSNPAAVDDGGTVLFCARGTDRAIHFNRLSGGAPTGWVTIDGVITSDPVLLPASPGAHFIARGDDGQLHLHGVGGASPAGWESLPAGGFISEPAVASFSGDIYVLGRGTDNQIWWSRRASGAWSGWQALSGQSFQGSPIAVNDGTALVVLAWGTDSQLWANLRTGASWGGWVAVPGLLLEPQTAYF